MGDLWRNLRQSDHPRHRTDTFVLSFAVVKKEHVGSSFDCRFFSCSHSEVCWTVHQHSFEKVQTNRRNRRFVELHGSQSHWLFRHGFRKVGCDNYPGKKAPELTIYFSSKGIYCGSMCSAHYDCHAYYYDASLCYEAGSSGLLIANPDLSNGRLVYVDSVVAITTTTTTTSSSTTTTTTTTTSTTHTTTPASEDFIILKQRSKSFISDLMWFLHYR